MSQGSNDNDDDDDPIYKANNTGHKYFSSQQSGPTPSTWKLHERTGEQAHLGCCTGRNVPPLPHSEELTCRNLSGSPEGAQRRV